MKTYAYVDAGQVRSIYTPEFDLPLDDQMPAEMAKRMVKLTASQAAKVAVGWFYDGKTFSAPDDLPTPEPAQIITPRAFRQRFTAEERAALTLAASRGLEAGDATLQVFLDDLSASQEVDLSHPDLHAGMEAIVAAGLIKKARAAEIVTP